MDLLRPRNIASSGITFQTHVQLPIMTKVLAVWAALRHTIHLGFTKIWLRSDSLGLIRAIVSVIKPKNLHGISLGYQNPIVLLQFLFFFLYSKSKMDLQTL
ncbi:unnamed protein product [Brassica rapa]|uniref:RNase H type-1 domain-containing protein n=1 Tax=Brassica campestris TaxID=3711 RepID=A0A8D9H4T1_BRACM|nr:unnamed protein product [Brassica rapa]